ncbi:latrophilin-like protein LAT-2 isoform X2 [Homalodisca vitripennis]|uniref:latrophilin-like protein LAT-2 isoform X2 n=1 Tax=Homalodisca vitripennis TaxID=197043 RepID=UPI001EEC1087|nr:latrophilin-like protein LAT-2 isoform X2 [Homalodisca vitripennis]
MDVTLTVVAVILTLLTFGQPSLSAADSQHDDGTTRKKSGRLRFSRLEHEPRIYAAAPSGVSVTRIRAFDIDDPSVTPFYRLLGDSVPEGDAQYFQIHSESGNLTTKRYIDRPPGSIYNIMVVAYNNGESEYIDIAIHVTEYNKYAPVFRSSNYKIEVELIAPVGTEIIRVQAVDNDPQPYNSEIYYYVQSRVVSVNRTSGLISLRENLHPKDRVFTIGLLAFDGGSPRRMARSILTINVKILSAPRELSVEQTGDQWAMLCWSPPLSGSPSGYMIYLTSTTDFMSDRAPSVTTQRNVSREELGTRAGRNCTALTDLESWSDFEARIAGWDRSEIGMISKAVTFDTKVNRTCYNLNNSQFKCSCLAGFYGEDCSKFNPCSSTVSPCQHGGSCTSSGSNQYECSCPSGYQGRSCEIFNPCSQTACKNGGVCENKTSTEFGCTCPSGFSGSLCEVEVNECSSSPCLNNGRCGDEPGGFRCICMPGFDGEHCEINVDECQSEPCHNSGTCVDLVEGYSCNCSPGFTGTACEIEINECSSNPCENNGTCVDDTPGYTCICSAGFEGDYCEEETNECSSWPCFNDGTCVDGINDYKCVCPPGYTGRRCDIDLDMCAEKPCKNGGICVEKTNKIICNCPPGYNGTYCQLKERCSPDVQNTKKGTFVWPEVEFNTTVQLECPFGLLSSVVRDYKGQDLSYKSKTKKTINKENADSLFLSDDERGKKEAKIQNQLSRTGKAFAERSCLVMGDRVVWSPVQDSNCEEEGYSVAEQLTLRLENLTRLPSQINASMFLEATSQLRQVLTYALVDKKIARSMVQVLSSILEMNTSVLDEADGNGSVSRQLVETINMYTSRARMSTPGSNLAFSSPNLAVDIRLVEKSSVSSKSGIRFSPTEAADSPEASGQRRGSAHQITIVVPQEAVSGVGAQEQVRMQFVFYRNGKLFRDRRRPWAPWEMPVLSARLLNVTVRNLSKAVSYTLPLPSSLASVSHTAHCVYWDSLRAQWLSSGLKTNSSGGLVVCEANHLTAFSVLLDPQPGRHLAHDHEAVLTAISYFGALLSITGLMLTVLTYSIFRCLNRDRSGKILLNLCISLLFMNISFLVISIKEHIDVYEVNTCMIVVMLAHYFVLTSLSWMLVEAVNMYQLLITVFASSETRFIIKRMIFAWGWPLCVVGGTLYHSGIEYYRFKDPDWCLFSPSSITIYYVTFVGPACFILVVNTSVFLMVSRVICQRQTISKNGHKNDDGVTAAQVRGAFTVMTLLGVTWIFGIFAVGDFRLLFQYIFSVANSLQGFIIFIVRCVQYPEARRAWGGFLRTGELKSHRSGKNRGTSTRNTSSSSQTRGTGTIKGDIAWGGVRARANQERMRELRTEIVRPRTNMSGYSSSFTLPRLSQAPQPIVFCSMSRSRSLHLEDNSSKEGEDTSWRFMAPSAPPAPTDQGYGTAEHSPESPRQQPRPCRQQPPPHLSVSTPERLHSTSSPGPGPSARSESDMVAGPPQPQDTHYLPRRESDATTTGPASHSSTSTISSPTHSPSTTPTFSPTPSCYDVHVWSQIPLVGEDSHSAPKRVHCEELL